MAQRQSACHIVEIVGKGKGLVATRFLARGTLIVAEKPIIQLPRGFNENMTQNEMRDYASNTAMEILMTFPGDSRPDQIITSRFKHFLPMDDNKKFVSGLFETICRANHSCIPNAFFSWNDSQGKETLYATVDIQKGEEIEVMYIDETEPRVGGDCRAYMEREFGFTCMCPACDRLPEERMQVAARTREYVAWRDNELPNSFGSKPPLVILDRLEEYTLRACADGFWHEIGPRCNEAYQLCAYYGDAVHAAQWEAINGTMQTICRGKDSVNAAESRRCVAHPGKFWAFGMFGKRQLRGPSAAMKACVNRTPVRQIRAAVATTVEAGSPTASDQVAAPVGTKALSKGQKKKMKEKQKKAAEQVQV
ncbi:SET domain-containing protein [Trametopsis cervina]|nr:SET domain-containing protein [Trametopsis cervina]